MAVLRTFIMLSALMALNACSESAEQQAKDDERVISAALKMGFTNSQAKFLRHGPLYSQSTCKLSGFDDKKCEFFAYYSMHYKNEKQYDFDCTASGLNENQCAFMQTGPKYVEAQK